MNSGERGFPPSVLYIIIKISSAIHSWALTVWPIDLMWLQYQMISLPVILLTLFSGDWGPYMWLRHAQKDESGLCIKTCWISLFSQFKQCINGTFSCYFNKLYLWGVSCMAPKYLYYYDRILDFKEWSIKLDGRLIQFRIHLGEFEEEKNFQLFLFVMLCRGGLLLVMFRIYFWLPA